MKKILKIIILAICFTPTLKSFAAGGITVSPSSLSIEEGSSKTFTISAYNTIGDVAIASNDPSIATVNAGEWGTGMVEEAQTKSGTITVQGKKVGSTTITLTIDAATFDGDDLAGQIKTVKVNVVAKPTPQPQPQPEPQPQPQPEPQPESKPQPTPQPEQSQPENESSEELSDNYSLKELKVEGHDVTKSDAKNYNLSVNNDVSTINIVAIAEDSSARVEGAGTRELNVGENEIEIKIISESGKENIIRLRVIRRNIFEWMIEGKTIYNPEKFPTKTEIVSERKKEIIQLSNYAEGKILTIAEEGKIPQGAKLAIYVGDDYLDEEIINIYFYDQEKNKLIFVSKNNSIENGYITIEPSRAGYYFITQSDVFRGNSKLVENAIGVSIVVIFGVSLCLSEIKTNRNSADN